MAHQSWLQSSIVIPVPSSFCLQSAVCSYGYFMTAPNVWEPAAAGQVSAMHVSSPPLEDRLDPGVSAEGECSLSPADEIPELPPGTSSDCGTDGGGAGVSAGAGVASAQASEDTPLNDSVQPRSSANLWAPCSPGAFSRPLRLRDGHVAWIRVTEVKRARLGGDMPPGPSASGPPAREESCGGLPGGDKGLRLAASAGRGLGQQDWETLEGQVRRMLRLGPSDEHHLQQFHSLHAESRAANFGRLFRSPTLWEDMLKSILLCNCGWGRTLSMCRALCELQAEMSSQSQQTGHVSHGLRDAAMESGSETTSSSPPAPAPAQSRSSTSSSALSPLCGAFPTPTELASLDPAFVGRRCGLGYRATRVVAFARVVASGEYDLDAVEQHAAVRRRYEAGERPSCSTVAAPGTETTPESHLDAMSREGDRVSESEVEDLRRSILGLPGFGPYSAANVLQCLGIFDLVPADSETVRHLKHTRKLSSCTTKNVARLAQEAYSAFAPYQFLVYWWELKQGYELVFGPIGAVPSSEYGKFTGPNMRKGAAQQGVALIGGNQSPALKKTGKAKRGRPTEQQDTEQQLVLVGSSQTCGGPDILLPQLEAGSSRAIESGSAKAVKGKRSTRSTRRRIHGFALDSSASASLEEKVKMEVVVAVTRVYSRRKSMA